jgi:hypothetical protein
VIKTKTVTEWGVNYVSEQYMNLDWEFCIWFCITVVFYSYGFKTIINYKFFLTNIWR